MLMCLRACFNSLSLTEKLKSQALINAGTVLVLLSVVVEGGVVSGCAQVGRLSQLERSECVHEEEGCELETVLVGAEHVLVVQEVSTEEEKETLEVDDFGELSVSNQAGARSFVVLCHFSFNL